MWINPLYRTDDEVATARRVVAAHPVAVLIALDPLRIAHMPVLWGATEDGSNVLTGHVPRADPITAAVGSSRLTAVFPGPTAYVSPNWYIEAGLPTYNYVPVHIHGHCRELDEWELRKHLNDLIAASETASCARLSPETDAAHGRARPWTPDAIAQDRIDTLLPAIVGFELHIEHLEVKIKLGQNRSEEERRRVVEQLNQRKGSDDGEVASFMSARSHSRLEQHRDPISPITSPNPTSLHNTETS